MFSIVKRTDRSTGRIAEDLSTWLHRGTCRMSSASPPRSRKVLTSGPKDLHSFSKTKNLRDELGCTLHKVEMERRQRIASAMEMDRDITELQVALRARIRGLLAPMSITSEKKCMEFANRDFSAIVNIR
jgi:hypothetical protein